jgi:phospholipase/lecithinase/hemolysin
VVTVMAGVHDVLDAYIAFDSGGLTREQALAQVGAAGARLGALVNRMAAEGAGGRVIYSTIPDIGLSPYAIAQKAAKTDIDRQQLLIDLSAKFNERLRLSVINDGRYVGLVTADEQLQVMARYPASYGVANAVDAACDVSQYDGQGDSETVADQAGVYSAFAIALPATQQVIGCSTLTLASAAAGSASTYLWADDLRPSPAWQVRVGAAAVSRALTNPF